MKRGILVLMGFLITLTLSVYSQKASRVEEYLNESKESKEISVSKDEIKSKKTPGVGFSIEGKKGVNQEFLSDEFVKSVISDRSLGVKMGEDGDLEFEPSKEKVDYSDSLKDDEDYTDEEIAYWASVSDQYYQFKDFDQYENFYYYYDADALEKNKKKDKKDSLSSFSGVSSIRYYISRVVNSFFPSQISYAVGSQYQDALNYYYGNSSSSSQSRSNSSHNSVGMKYDVAKAAGANSGVLQEALNYFNSNSGKFSNKRFMAVLEYSKHSARSRFYIINLRTGEVNAAYHVAHGSGSDRDNDGYATYFSNVPNSKASSLGVYKTGEIYRGKYGRSLRLHGLSPTNSNVYRRAIVIHPSPYVKEANVKAGRSWGCMAFDYKVSGDVINMLRDGALIYAKYTR